MQGFFDGQSIDANHLISNLGQRPTKKHSIAAHQNRRQSTRVTAVSARPLATIRDQSSLLPGNNTARLFDSSTATSSRRHLFRRDFRQSWNDRYDLLTETRAPKNKDERSQFAE